MIGSGWRGACVSCRPVVRVRAGGRGWRAAARPATTWRRAKWNEAGWRGTGYRGGRWCHPVGCVRPSRSQRGWRRVNEGGRGGAPRRTRARAPIVGAAPVSSRRVLYLSLSHRAAGGARVARASQEGGGGVAQHGEGRGGERESEGARGLFVTLCDPFCHPQTHAPLPSHPPPRQT